MAISARRAYTQQKNNAKARGIDWQFTFETWLSWWGADIGNRGVRAWNLQMQRIADAGPYHPDNVRKGHPRGNIATAKKVQRRDATLASAARISAMAVNNPARAKHWGDLSDDDRELEKMVGVRTVTRWRY